MAVSDEITEEEEEEEDSLPSLASTTTKKRPIMRTATPLPGKQFLPTFTGVLGTTNSGTTTNTGDWKFLPRAMVAPVPEMKKEEQDEEPFPAAAATAADSPKGKRLTMQSARPLSGKMPMSAADAPAPSATRGESEETLPTSNTTTSTAYSVLLAFIEEGKDNDESVTNAAVSSKNEDKPPLRGPCRASTPLPSQVPPKSTDAEGGSSIPASWKEEKKEDTHNKQLHPKGPGTRTSTPLLPLTNTKLKSGDLEQQVMQVLEPRSAGRISSNAVKGLPRELSIQGHYDDDDMTMVTSLDEKNNLSQTKQVHKRQVVDAFGERGLYTGSLNVKSHMPDGCGVMAYRQKRTYQGDWIQGHWHGHGKFLNSLEDIYEGTFVMDQKEGQGKLIFNDGRVFTGRFQKDQMREGKLHFQDASFYQGLLRDGKRRGFGLYVFSDQSQYEGQWESDCMHGRGRMDWSDGGWYNGHWEMGVQHGIGMEVLPDGTLRHRGTWYKGNPVHEHVPI
jgi:hypothetical protein